MDTKKIGGEPTAMTLAFIEAEKRKPKEKTVEELKPVMQQIWEYLFMAGEPQNVPQIAKAIDVPKTSVSSMVAQLTQRGRLKRHTPLMPDELVTWSALEAPGGAEWSWGKATGRRGPYNTKKTRNAKREASAKQSVSQVVTEERKVMRALPGGPTLNVEGYIFTIAEAKKVYKALKELFE